MRYVYLAIAIVGALFLSSCSETLKRTTYVRGKVEYAVMYIDTVHDETTFVNYPAKGADVYLIGDPDATYPYAGEVLQTKADSQGWYSFAVEPVADYEGPAPSYNIGIKIQAFYFDSFIGPAYGELSGFEVTPGKEHTLPTIYLKRQTQ